jgi:DNA polymerase-3 subunit alpha
MVEDFVSYARKNNIEIGTRGSVVGSVLAYSLDITSIEPIENGLKFERFLNESRVDKPDIDLDIQKSKLEEMIQYAKKKYGIENVAKIITFTSFGFRSAVISIRNVYGIKTTIEDRIPKIETSLEDFYKTEMFENLKMWMNINGYSKILEEARMIADKVQTISVHPAGLVISSDIKDIPTITKDGEKIILVTINNKQLEKLGFVKFDFLSSNILANIYETRKIINYFEPIDFKDPEIYKVLWTNNSYGLFQMKSWGIKDFAKKIQPQNLGDVMDVIAMYRPGPKDQIDAYIKNRREKNFLLVDENGEKLKETIILENILKRTNAILIYQEQVMEISEVWAGFSKVESDNFRKYISAKEREKLQFQIDLFKERSKELGRDEYTTEQLISLIIKFADYGFPKSHAASYAKVTLETAFLKRYYPREFLVVLANADIRDKKKKIGELVVEMKRNGIKVIPPTFKNPVPLFELKNDEIYYGFRAMVGIGEKDIEKIKNIDVRRIENIAQLLAEKSMDVRVKEIFVKAGCLDHIADRWEILVQLRREKSEYKENKNELEKKKIYKKWEKDILRI